MQRFVGTLGWSMAFLALASCAPGSSGPQGGTGGNVGGTGGAPGTGGNVQQPGTGGTTGAGGSSSGGATGSGGASSGGATGSGGSSSGGATGSGGSSMGGTTGSGGSAGRGGGQGTGGATPSGGAGGAGGDDWMPLFNGTNLTGWTPSQGHTALFAAGMLAGEPVIHVYPTQADQSNQPEATLRTNASYSSYVFHIEYKWGTKRYGGRATSERDNGICFHICNNPAQVWPESIEFQLGEQALAANTDWVSGHIFMLINKTRAQWTSSMVNGLRVFSETGTRSMIGAPTSYQKAMTDKRRDKPTEWNIVELTVHGSKDATYMVNGEVANRVTDMECQVNNVWGPLDRGPIALQAEYAEIYFRNPKIKILPP
jgi:hypothetical protein